MKNRWAVPTAIALLQNATNLGLKLGSEGRHTLTVEPAERCPRAFADTLKDYKWHLLALLRLPFVMVFSVALDQAVFFCEDEDTKVALVEAGADPWSVYSKEEIRILVGQNRIAPLLSRGSGNCTRSNEPLVQGLTLND